MNDELKIEILSLLESPELREYLMAPPEKLCCTQYAEIICGASVSLYRKRELLLRLKAETPEEDLWAILGTLHCIEDAPKALEHPSVIADGWQRAVRLDGLGDGYGKESIRERCLENQRKPELYAVAYPEWKRAPLLTLECHLRQAHRKDTITLLFEIFITLLKICTGSNIEEQQSRPLSPS